MPIVCINRPNRSKPRLYTCRDVERIIKTALIKNPEVTKSCLIDAALKATDTKEGLCKTIKIWRTVRGLQDTKTIIAVISALITIIGGLISILRRQPSGRNAIGTASQALGAVPQIRGATTALTLLGRLLARLIPTQFGKLITALGAIQLILIAIREALDTFTDVILPILDVIVCTDD